MRRRSLLLSLLVIILVAGNRESLPSSTANAPQESTPEASFPVTPASAECTVEPRPVESLTELLGTPVADGAPDRDARPTEPSSAEVPIGEWADEEVREGIITTVVESSACFNAGDSGRGFALFTDAFLQGYVAENALTAEDIAFLAAGPEPVLPEARQTILAVTDVSTLDDGRAGAFVVTSSKWSGPGTSYLLFVQSGERWLVDEVIEFMEA